MVTPREGESCVVCGYPVADRGGLCDQCSDYQGAAQVADAAVAARPCKHCGAVSSELRKKRARNGTWQFGFQCLSCGCSTSSWIKHDLIGNRDSVASWDEEAHDRYWSGRREEIARRRELDASDRKVQYQAYLRSQKWRAIRSRVMSRAGGTCEGCGILPAHEVHHLTYENIGDELLFQLVALCEDCHEKVHRQKAVA